MEISTSLWHTWTVASLDFTPVLLIALGLSADCFAVAVSSSVSIRAPSTVQLLRISLAFAASQALMPLLGWLAGRTVVDLVEAYDHWVAFAILAVVGSRMIWESFHSKGNRSKGRDITKGVPLVALSIATSIDALAVGLSFAFLEVNMALASSTIGIVAFVVTAMGFLLGRQAGNLVEKGAEVVGGVVLIGIGLRILLTHTL